MKKIFLIPIIVVIVAVFLIAGRVLGAQKHAAHGTNHAATTHTKVVNATPQNAANMSASLLAVLPKPPFSCSTNASLMDLSRDYSITDLKCDTYGNTAQLRCNGVLIKNSTVVSIDCYTPNYTATTNQLICNGSTALAPGSSDLSLHYSCYLSDIASKTPVYVCNGVVAGFQAYGLSLPVNVSCSS